MANTVQEIYTQFISTLPPAERLQLATLILNGLVQQNVTAIDDSDTWTDQDRLDLTAYSIQYAATAFSDDEDIAK